MTGLHTLPRPLEYRPVAMLRFVFAGGLCWLLIAGMALEASRADITPEDRTQARRIQNALSTAERQLKDRKFAECTEAVKRIQENLETLTAAGDPDVIRLVQTHYRRLRVLHGLLELEGYTLPALVIPDPDAEPSGEPGGTLFTSQVAPILVGKCGRCHIDRASGGFSMSTFDVLMRGPTEGRVVLPGDADGSRIIEVIEEGDMPRGGGRVTDEELAVLKEWIVQGARYDAEDRNAGLATLIPEGEQVERPMAEVVASTGNETISFAADIAPVLIANCNGCHINAQNLRGGLNMSNFQSLIRGGDNGSMIVQGNPAESLLIGKLRGTAGGQRMPQGRPPLDDEVIAKFEKWIEEGATYDGGEANLAIETVAAVAKAANATHEELSQDRLAGAQRNWDLAMPGVAPNMASSDNFFIIGNTDQAALDEMAQSAEKLVPQIARLFRGNSREPLVKGKVAIFVFRQRYDYSEFGQMVERRQLPDDWKGHWRYTVVDAYGAIIPPRTEEEYSLDALLAQQIAGNLAASLGDSVPDWFAEGAARVAAARVERDDPRVTQWLDSLPEVLASMQKPEDFLTGSLNPENTAIASYSFVEFLMKDSRRYNQLLRALRDGELFDRAFGVIYGGTPAQVAALWARSNPGGRRR